MAGKNLNVIKRVIPNSNIDNELLDTYIINEPTVEDPALEYVEIRNYSHNGKHAKTKYFCNGNDNLVLNLHKRTGGDTRARLRRKLQAKQLNASN